MPDRRAGQSRDARRGDPEVPPGPGADGATLPGTTGLFTGYGKVYCDVGHIEIALSELDTPYLAVSVCERMQTLATRAVAMLRDEGLDFVLANNNHSGLLTNDCPTWGSHENYLAEKHPTSFGDAILPFLVTRLYGGSGGVQHPSGDFLASVRSTCMALPSGGSTTGAGDPQHGPRRAPHGPVAETLPLPPDPGRRAPQPIQPGPAAGSDGAGHQGRAVRRAARAAGRGDPRRVRCGMGARPPPAERPGGVRREAADSSAGAPDAAAVPGSRPPLRRHARRSAQLDPAAAGRLGADAGGLRAAGPCLAGPPSGRLRQVRAVFRRAGREPLPVVPAAPASAPVPRTGAARSELPRVLQSPLGVRPAGAGRAVGPSRGGPDRARQGGRPVRAGGRDTGSAAGPVHPRPAGQHRLRGRLVVHPGRAAEPRAAVLRSVHAGAGRVGPAALGGPAHAAAEPRAGDPGRSGVGLRPGPLRGSPSPAGAVGDRLPHAGPSADARAASATAPGCWPAAARPAAGGCWNGCSPASRWGSAS